MWRQAVRFLRCPECGDALTCKSDDDDEWIDTGALCCEECRNAFPVFRGVPILLVYSTVLAERAHHAWPESFRRSLLRDAFHLPTGTAPVGEKLVGETFSTEWAAYDYGPTLWTASTLDRVRTFHGECGVEDGALAGKTFCEVGCGLGVLTNEAAERLGAEAWGVDVSSSVFRAAVQFKSNRSLHFVQASILHAPFAPQKFDFVYSHGVLHHTWSTKEAVARAANLVRPGGALYVWLYGEDDTRVSLARRMAYVLESCTRPLIARLPPKVATLALSPLIPIYQVASYLGRGSTHGATYSAQQAMHAVRDRFTPLFAHRHQFNEVAGWYEDMGFADIHKINPREVSASWALAMERNVAIRGRRKPSGTALPRVGLLQSKAAPQQQHSVN